MWQKIKNYYHLIQAALAAVFFNFPSNHIQVIAVTGTDGKTTTVHMIYQILKSAGQKASMISSIYASIGSKTYDTGFHVTTPGSWQIQKLLRRAVDAGHKYFIIEATSHALDQNRLAFINIDTAVLTNITHEHLDYHKTWQKYAQSKFKLFKRAKKTILNFDDQNSFVIFSKKLKNTITYSLNQKADYNLQNFNINLKIPGVYNLSNALAAVAATSSFGMNRTKILKALANFQTPKGRMDKINLKQNFSLYVDFAHTPNALKQVLTFLRSQIDGRTSVKLIVVFGAASQRDRAKRPLMGQVADELADVVVLTSEDPRKENPMKIIEEIAKGIKNKKLGHDLFQIADRHQAINFAVDIAKAGDIVVTCGKGHEKSISIKGKETSWDEYEAAKSAIRRKKNV